MFQFPTKLRSSDPTKLPSVKSELLAFVEPSYIRVPDKPRTLSVMFITAEFKNSLKPRQFH